jgi:hypothetical protein
MLTLAIKNFGKMNAQNVRDGKVPCRRYGFAIPSPEATITTRVRALDWPTDLFADTYASADGT